MGFEEILRNIDIFSEFPASVCLCCGMEEVSPSVKILSYPSFMCFAFNRVMWNNELRKPEKISTKVNFPMGKFDIEGNTFELIGVVEHLGKNSSLYISFVENCKWVLFDDETSTIVTESRVESSNPAILVFKKF